MNCSIFRNLNELRLQGALCDAVLKVRDAEIKVHKIILSVCSPFFRTLFTHGQGSMEENVYILDVSPDVMNLIVQFAYMCDIDINSDNVEELLSAAYMLDMPDLVRRCCRFLETVS